MRLPYGCRITRPIHICIETKRMVLYTSDSQRKSAFPFYIEKYYTKMIATAATLPLDTRNALLVARFSTSQTYKYKHTYTYTHSQTIYVALNFWTRCQCGGFVFNDVQYVFRSIFFEFGVQKGLHCIQFVLYFTFQVYLCAAAQSFVTAQNTTIARQTRAVFVEPNESIHMKSNMYTRTCKAFRCTLLCVQTFLSFIIIVIRFYSFFSFLFFIFRTLFAFNGE